MSGLAKRARGTSVVAAIALSASLALAVQESDGEYLGWTADRAEAIGKAAYQKGRVGGWFDTRLLKSERAYNYKLAATWLSDSDEHPPSHDAAGPAGLTGDVALLESFPLSAVSTPSRRS